MENKKRTWRKHKEREKHTYTQVKFRLNEEELAIWQQKATERNLTLPKFSKQVVEQALTHGKVEQPKMDKQQGTEMVKHLAKLGGNVNQIAKWCNTHKADVSPVQAQDLENSLDTVREELKRVWQQLK